MIHGLFQWDAPGVAGELVALAAGHLFHKAPTDTEFTQVAASLTTSRIARFAPWREGATIVLYFADGALRKWDGTTLTSTISNAPSATDVAIYKGRVFAIDETKKLYASKIRDGDEWQLAQGAVQADVETYDTEGLRRILVAGSSLILFKEDNIARFTGVDPADIRIDTETEGVADDVGLAALGSLVRVDEAFMFLSQKGWYLGNEASVEPTGLQVQAEFDSEAVDISAVLAEYHKDRNEVWCSKPDGDTWIYNLRSRSWDGPLTTLTPTALARYERANGSETLVWGGADGYVREEDVESIGAKSDVLRDGSAGTATQLDIEFPVILGGWAARTKSFPDLLYLQADLGTAWNDPDGGRAEVYWTSELGSGSVFIESKGPGIKSYPFKLAARGRRITIGIREATSELTKIYGLSATPALGGTKNP